MRSSANLDWILSVSSMPNATLMDPPRSCDEAAEGYPRGVSSWVLVAGIPGAARSRLPGSLDYVSVPPLAGWWSDTMTAGSASPATPGSYENAAHTSRLRVYRHSDRRAAGGREILS